MLSLLAAFHTVLNICITCSWIGYVRHRKSFAGFVTSDLLCANSARYHLSCIHTTGRNPVGMHISSDKTGGTHVQLTVMNHYVNTFFQSQMTLNLIDFMIWREQLEMSIGTKALRLMLYGLSRGVLFLIAYCSVIANWQIPRKLAPSTSHLLTIHMN